MKNNEKGETKKKETGRQIRKEGNKKTKSRQANINTDIQGKNDILTTQIYIYIFLFKHKTYTKE